MGGDSTAFAVHMELAGTHITINPVAVIMRCHSARARFREDFPATGDFATSTCTVARRRDAAIAIAHERV